MYIADEPALSERVRELLGPDARRWPYTAEPIIRATAGVRAGHRRLPAPPELTEAMVRFEQRYGGLFYLVTAVHGMEYGLDGDATGHETPQGYAFTGIIDGDWTWSVDVLLDGRTAMAITGWPYRVIDRSVDQRLERHALLVAAKRWPHRTFTLNTPSFTPPRADGGLLPPAVEEATGPATTWWAGDEVMVELSLASWPGTHDTWQVRYFARDQRLAASAEKTVSAALGREVTPDRWCALCARSIDPDHTCVP